MQHLEHTYTVFLGTSLPIQWLRLCASNAGGVGSIPGWGAKILHAMQGDQKKNIYTVFCLFFFFNLLNLATLIKRILRGDKSL